MKIEGEWFVGAVSAKPKTKVSSGCKIVFSKPDSDLKSETDKSVIRLERWGTLKLVGGVDIEMKGKLEESVKYGKASDDKGAHVLTFTPSVRLSADEFTTFYIAQEEAVTAAFEDDQKAVNFTKGRKKPTEKVTS